MDKDKGPITPPENNKAYEFGQKVGAVVVGAIALVIILIVVAFGVAVVWNILTNLVH